MNQNTQATTRQPKGRPSPLREQLNAAHEKNRQLIERLSRVEQENQSLLDTVTAWEMAYDLGNVAEKRSPARYKAAPAVSPVSDDLGAVTVQTENRQTKHPPRGVAPKESPVTEGKELTNLRSTALGLEVMQSDLIAFLLEERLLYRDGQGTLLPYAKYIQNGQFVVKAFTHRGHFGLQTLVSEDGRALIADRYEQRRLEQEQQEVREHGLGA